MSLIKAAGRDRDVDRAFGIIQRLRENNVSCHILVFSRSFTEDDNVSGRLFQHGNGVKVFIDGKPSGIFE